MLKVFFFLGASPASVRAANFPSWNHFAWKKPVTSSEEEEAANGLSILSCTPMNKSQLAEKPIISQVSQVTNSV